MKIYQFDRTFQIKHFTDLSVLQGHSEVEHLRLAMAKDEKFVLQLVVVPEGEQCIHTIQCSGNLELYCINSDIVDKFGAVSKKEVLLEQGALQPLFFIAAADKTEGTQAQAQIELVTDKGTRTVNLTFDLTDEPVENSGFNELWRLARLDWLNSSRFLTDQVTAPYHSPQVAGRCIRVLGREVRLGKNGLPEQITSYFDESISLKETPQKELLFAPMAIQFGQEKMEDYQLTLTPHQSYVRIVAKSASAHLQVEITGTLQYEGFLDYQVRVTANEDVAVGNIAQKISLHSDCATYCNGLGAVGGSCKPLDFRWSHTKHLDALYVGAVNAGLRVKWKAEKYHKPLINIYYKNMPLVVPEETWDNHGKGKIVLSQTSQHTDVMADTSDFCMKKGESRHFDFELHLTPLKPIDYQKHYATRYSHNNKLKNERKEIDRAQKKDLTHVVVHHGNRVHPFINYPFIETQRLKQMVDYAAQKNLGVKIYYTVREHGNHMAEVFAYKALGDEIILRKKGEGYEWPGGTAKWLTTYFGDRIIPAWKVEYHWGKYRGDPDVSFIVRPNSRLDNYYIEGLDWLVKNMGIKGIYIDDTALDRTTIERARKVLNQNNGLIDMHMWNHEEERAGDVSCMNLYTELFPFIDSLWIGEGYPYQKLSPEYLLTEVSGIPYGQTSQMLEDGGDPYIGMLYAMNNRYGWGVHNAGRIYRLWDDFGIQDSEMRGYWHSKNPVKTGNTNVLATVYVKDNQALVCLFNFSQRQEDFHLEIDQNLLGFPVNRAEQSAIPKLQRAKSTDITKDIRLKSKQGLILTIRR